jgi:protein-disulfide isomerase
MEGEKKKFNPYIIIIIILLIVVGILAYNQWGRKSTGNVNSETKNVDIKISNDDIQIGKTDAPVTIVEYYSYLCEYCKLFEAQVKPQIIENYIQKGLVKLVLRVFPPYELGEAVLCANDQGKFLEYHNYLFVNNSKISSIDDLKTFAKNVGLNESSFNQCLDSKKYEPRVKGWYEQGISDIEKAGISKDKIGTPTFFVNGEAIVGAMPYEDFAKKIDSKLK